MKSHKLIRLSGVVLKAAILFMFFTSCENYVNVDVKKVPDTKPKLVVSSFISPDDTFITVGLASSIPLFGKFANQTIDTNLINQAIVTMTDLDLNITDTLKYTGANQKFSTDTLKLEIIQGHQYHLLVSIPGGNSVEANCTVPYRNNTFKLISVDSSSNGTGNWDYFITFSFTDDPSTNDFYGAMITEPDVFNPYYNAFIWEYGSPLTDKSGQGKVFTLKAKITGYGSLSHRLKIIIEELDENFYLYKNSVQNYNNSNGDPFSTPVLIYTNVSGGLGVFGAYNNSSHIFIF